MGVGEVPRLDIVCGTASNDQDVAPSPLFLSTQITSQDMAWHHSSYSFSTFFLLNILHF